MTRRNVLVGSIAVAAIALVFAWWQVRGEVQDVTAMHMSESLDVQQDGSLQEQVAREVGDGDASRARRLRIEADLARSPGPPAKPANHPWEFAVLSQYEAWRAAAETDPYAALYLGRELAGCFEKMERTPAEIDADLEEAVADAENSTNFEPEVRQRWVDGAIQGADRNKREYAECAAIGDEGRAEFLALIERAARAGIGEARVDYARLAFADMHDRADMLADLDTVIERRDLARAYLEHEVAAGNHEAIRVYGNAHLPRNDEASALYPDDPVVGVGYSRAVGLHRTRMGRGEADFRAEWTASLHGDQYWSRGLTDDEKARAWELAQRIYTRHFGDPPERE